MRGVSLSIAVLALAASAPALADGCPDKVTAQTEKSLGSVQGYIGDDKVVYQPARVKKLDTDVAYVIVDRAMSWDGGKYRVAGIERLRFRLKGVVRTGEDPFPADVRQAFDKAYPGSGCGDSGSVACAAARGFASGKGALQNAQLYDGDLYVDDGATGAVMQQVVADDEMDDAHPAFLVCDYQLDD